MFGVNCIFALVILSTFQVSFSLVSLPDVEDNDLLKTEEVIRSTTNTLFFSLGLLKSRNQGLKQYTLVHNYFVSLTLQDYTNLKEIAKLTRVDKTNIDKVAGNLIAVINEITEDEMYLKIKELTVFEANNIDNDLKKKEFIEAFYDDQDIDERILNILEGETYANNFQNALLQNKVVSKEDDEFIYDKTFVWRGHQLNIGRRLYNAKATKIKHFGFMASVEIFSRFQCAGSIIKSDLVITTASCLQLAHNNRFFRENPPFLSVRVGSTYFETGGEVIKVLEVYFYPSYVPRSLHNNIAIMRLQRRLKFNKKAVKKIEIDTHDTDLPYNTGRITVLGWGAKSASNSLHSPWESKLRYAELDIYDLRDCQEIYSKEYVTHKNFCAGYMSRGSGACNRDIGGPGIAYGKLVGLISFGAPVCGTPDAPTVFTKVGYYYDWIEEIMEQDVPYVRQKTTTTTLKLNRIFATQPPSNALGYFITPYASTPKKKASTICKKHSIRGSLKSMLNDSQIEEYLEAFKIQKMKQKLQLNKYATRPLDDSGEVSEYSELQIESPDLLRQMTNQLMTATISAVTQYVIPMTNINTPPMNTENEEMQKLILRLWAESGVVTNKNTTNFLKEQTDVISVTNPDTQSSNSEDKKMQSMFLKFLEKSNIPTNNTTVTLLKEHTDATPVTIPDKQSLNTKMSNIFNQLMVNLNVPIKNKTTAVLKENIELIAVTNPDKQSIKPEDQEMQELLLQLIMKSDYPAVKNSTYFQNETEYKDAEFENNLLSILSDNEEQNGTLRKILEDYAMTLFDYKEPLFKKSLPIKDDLLKLNHETDNKAEIQTTLSLSPNSFRYKHFPTLAQTSSFTYISDNTVYENKSDINVLFREDLEQSSTTNSYQTTTENIDENRGELYAPAHNKEPNIFGRKQNPNGYVNKIELSNFLSNDDIAAVVKEKKPATKTIRHCSKIYCRTNTAKKTTINLRRQPIPQRILTRLPRRHRWG